MNSLILYESSRHTMLNERWIDIESKSKPKINVVSTSWNCWGVLQYSQNINTLNTYMRKQFEVLSDVIIRKYQNRDGACTLYLAHGFFSQCHHKLLHWMQYNNSKNRCIRSGCLCQGMQKKVMVCRNYNIRNMIFSIYLVTKSDPM
jgi:Fe-S-cluster containining protein